jgi:glycosyltransferase involved in cell wall biosynthesis
MSEQTPDYSTLTTEQQVNKKILWLSNSPWAATGYGNQTRLFTPRLHKAGYEMMIAAFYGLEGGVINWGGIPILPKGTMPFGQDIAAAHAKARGAKYLISLIDAWIFNDSPFYDSLIREGVRWMPWFPVDSEPLPPPVREAVRRAYKRLVYSKFAQKEVEAAGLDCAYIPHGVDTEVFKPRDMLESRAELRNRGGMAIPDDCFLIGMVAANKGQPSRKAFTEQIAAFAEFKGKHRDAVLYLHTTSGEQGEYGGVNLKEFIDAVGLKVGRDVIFPNRYDLFMGMGDPVMRTLYSAMDVHLLVSSGEGFGIPIVEAQACGVPVIVGGWTSMPELCFSGWTVAREDSHPFWDALGAYKFLPRAGAIVDRLEAAYRRRGNQVYRDRARKGALEYDANLVTERYWMPFLESVFAEDATAEKEIAAVRQMMTKRIKANANTTRTTDPGTLGEQGQPDPAGTRSAE